MDSAGKTRYQDLVDQYDGKWQGGGPPPDIFAFIASHTDLSADELARICHLDQRQRWQRCLEIPLKTYFERLPATILNKQLKLSLIQIEIECARERGEIRSLESLLKQFPELAEMPCDAAAPTEKQAAGRPSSKTTDPDSPTKLMARDSSQILLENLNGSSPSSDEAKSLSGPGYIGRYRVLRVLGDGGFGRVYLAFDAVLTRNVAIKVPHRHLVAKSSDVQSYLKEARILSSLEHQAIIPVYDCGDTGDGLCFVVSKWIDGSDLAAKLKGSSYSTSASAELVAIIADALHFAHVKGVVHRDVKPANILLDSSGRPYLADFGIALRDEDVGTGHARIGTVSYMSPEQLRGEGHLVDGRSDVFSLGVVFYEMLTARRPFPSNRLEYSAKIVEPRPPRQIDDSIPKELERICLKALSYRVADRYITAMDMAADLRMFLQPAGNPSSPISPSLSGSSKNATSGQHVPGTGILMVPKGLRSFDRDDASFFLELLPGARGRDGLPESVRFWKNRILAADSETFRVAVIYGPSGCGKSSFLKAAVLPQVSSDVVPVYLEATPLETESRLLRALRKNFPALSHNTGLAESLAILRRQHRALAGQRILIVIDQFEQWLHGKHQRGADELQVALRQCDGANVQCIITVRDDFWMAVTQFMDELEVTLVPGDNLAAIDLFNVRHARRVLTAIGQAYGILSPNSQEITVEQRAFIEHAVVDLARNDQIIPVQLALFAEMVKDKEWSLATLKSIGGTEGVGVTFLEETFNGRTANPNHRLHQKSARLVLQALLSEGSAGIKGTMRSHTELQQVSGYSDEPKEFESLLRILDADLRLITPTDPDGLDPDRVRTDSSHSPHERYYHLTHDYLVPSLKEWLTRKRKETRRGRAELILTERAEAWNHQKSTRSLPTLFEWVNILLFAGRQVRFQNRSIVVAAARYYGSRILAATLILGMGIWGVTRRIEHTRATSIVESLSSAHIRGVSSIIESLAPHRRDVDPMLKEVLKNSNDPSTKLRASLALLKNDSSNQETVYEGLLTASPQDFATICDLLHEWGDRTEITKRLWREVLDTDGVPRRRFRAGAALASFETPAENQPSANWQRVTGWLARRLVQEIGANLGDFNDWVTAFAPARNALYSDLRQVFSDPDAADVDRYTAATILADFVQDQPTKLADLTLIARPREYPVFVTKLIALGQQGESALHVEFAVTAPDGATQEERFQIEKRKAYAAISLLEFGTTVQLMKVFSASVDSMQCTYAEDRLSRLGRHPENLFRLMNHAQADLKAALLRSLAGMKVDCFSANFRETLYSTVERIFETDPDPGLHSAAQWALRSWGLTDRLSELTKKLASPDSVIGFRWYINGQGQTMIMFKGPVESRTGSPLSEPDRDSDEEIVVQQIQRSFAVCSTEVTAEQYLKFHPDFPHVKKKDTAPSPESPVSTLTWYRAAEYCNWLSKVEGIPEDQWCYVPTDYYGVKTNLSPQGEKMSTYMPKDNCLTLRGYRLVTEAEWEYACRAGTTTAFSWGEDPELSPRYSLPMINLATPNWRVATMCPNRFGFFDMHAGVAEWVQNLYKKRPAEIDRDPEDGMPRPEFDVERTIRGGSSRDLVFYQRSANRIYGNSRSGTAARTGFRIGRTISDQ